MESENEENLFTDPHWAAPFLRDPIHWEFSTKCQIKYFVSVFLFSCFFREHSMISISKFDFNETTRLKCSVHHICMLQRHLSDGLKMMMMGAQINSVVIHNTPSTRCLRADKPENKPGRHSSFYFWRVS